jgi:hypothetical protein
MGIESSYLTRLKYYPRIWFRSISKYCAWDINWKLFIAWRLGFDVTVMYFLLGIFGVCSLSAVLHSASNRTGSVSVLRRKSEGASADLGATVDGPDATNISFCYIHSGRANPFFHPSAGADLIPDTFCVLFW